MYAKWIHPKKIVIHEGDILRYNGRIVIHPKHKDFIQAGYYPLLLTEKQSENDPNNIYIVKEQSIVILQEEEV